VAVLLRCNKINWFGLPRGRLRDGTPKTMADVAGEGRRRQAA